MEINEIRFAITAVSWTASALGLQVDDAVVLQNSNKLGLRLLPSNTFARVALIKEQHVAQFEVKLADMLAETKSPAAALEPRVPRLVFERDGFAITLWTYYAPLMRELAAIDYANALQRLHAGMRMIKIAAPHFTDRILEAEKIVANQKRTSELPDTERKFLSGMLESLQRLVVGREATEQFLHGEPHPGNVLNTKIGPLFIDLETCCWGAVEFDLAHMPEEVAEHYPGIDRATLNDCRGLVLAMVTSWRWDADDQFPNGRQWAEHLIQTLHKGPPWPSLQVLAKELDGCR